MARRRSHRGPGHHRDILTRVLVVKTRYGIIHGRFQPFLNGQLEYLLAAAERTNMYEMRPSPERRLYRPRAHGVEPFTLPD